VLVSGEIGEVITIQHSENVSTWHYAHSYVRGSWRSRSHSSPMILAKSCHDLDLLCWFADASPTRLTSLERPTQLCLDNAPDGAPDFCIEGCPHAAARPYDAVAAYRDMSPLLIDLRMSSAPAAMTPPEAEAAAAIRSSALPRASGWTGWPISVITNDPTPQGIDRALRSSRYGR